MFRKLVLVFLATASIVSAFDRNGPRAEAYSNTTTTLASSSPILPAQSGTETETSALSLSISLSPSSSTTTWISAPSLMSPTTAASPASLTSSVASSTSSPSSTSIGSTSFTTSLNATVTTAPNGTLAYCCSQAYAPMIGLAAWYTGSHINVTVATVISIYAQYNNTKVFESLSTINAPNATLFYGEYGVNNAAYESTYTGSETIPGVPNTLVPLSASLYGATSVGAATEITFTDLSLTITSPTPFFLFKTISFYTGVSTVGDTAGNCQVPVSTGPPIATLTTDGTIATVTEPGTTTFYSTIIESKRQPSDAPATVTGPIVSMYTGNIQNWLGDDVQGMDGFLFVSPDKDMYPYLAEFPYISSQYPQIGSCLPPRLGEGAPTVHVPVAGLTHTTESVYTKTGVYTGSPRKVHPESTETSLLIPTSIPVYHSAHPEQPESSLEIPSKTSSHASVVALTAHVESTGSSLDIGDSHQTLTSENGGFTVITATAHVESTGDQLNVPTSDNDNNNAPGTTSKPVIWVSTIAIQSAPGTSHPTTDGSSVTAIPVPVIIIGSNTVTQDEGGGYIIPSTIVGGSSDQTLSAGGPAITDTSGSTYQIPSGGSAVVVNGQTSPIVTPAGAVVTFGGVAPTYIAQAETLPGGVSIGNNGNYVVAGQTISLGGFPVVIAGTTYSIAESSANAAGALVVNGISSSLPEDTAGVLATPVGSSGEYVIAGQTLVPGGSAVTFEGTTYSLVSGKNGESGSIVIDGATSPLPTAAMMQATETGFSSKAVQEYVVSGNTLIPGSGITVSGTTISLDASGATIFINGILTTFPNSVSGTFTVAGLTILPIKASAYIINGKTLYPGAPAITVDGTTYSLPTASPTSGSPGVIVINGVTSPLPYAFPSITDAPSIASAAIVVLGGRTYTLSQTVISGTTEVIIGTQTLAPGSMITIEGTTLSLAPGGTGVLVAGSNGAQQTSKGDAIASAIMNVLNFGASSTSTTSMRTTSVSEESLVSGTASSAGIDGNSAGSASTSSPSAGAGSLGRGEIVGGGVAGLILALAAWL